MKNKESTNPKTDADGKIFKRQKVSMAHCCYNKPKNIENLRDHSLTEIQDVEDLIQEGKKLNACPYYASRKAAEDAQIVLIPYNTLLHKNTRNASGKFYFLINIKLFNYNYFRNKIKE